MLEVLIALLFLLLEFCGANTLGQAINTTVHGGSTLEEKEQTRTEMIEEDYINNYDEDQSIRYKHPVEFLDLSEFEEGCGTHSKVANAQNRINGGAVSAPHAFPWIVRIHG